MFNLGDTVVYRRHVCTIAQVRENYYQNKDYLELHAIFERSLKLYVCIDDACPPVLREPISADEANALLDRVSEAQSFDEESLAGSAASATLLERRIKEEYERLMKTLVPFDLVLILKEAMVRTERREQAGRPVASVDKKYRDMAEQFLYDELSVALGIDREDAVELVKERL